jgi:hypothetical protein
VPIISNCSNCCLENKELNIIGCIAKHSQIEENFKARRVQKNVKDIACYDKFVVFTTNHELNEPSQPGIYLVMVPGEHNSWISFGGKNIHVGIKHLKRPEFQNAISQDCNYNQSLYKYNWTPLHHAILHGVSLPELLYASEMNVSDYTKLSPLDYVIRQNNPPAYQAFQKNILQKKIMPSINPKTFVETFINSPATEINFHSLLKCKCDLR